MSRISLSLSAAAAALVLSLGAWPLAVEAGAERTAAPAAAEEPTPVDEDDVCDEYYACIDACAEEYTHDSDFCYDTYPRGGAEQKGCLALADDRYEDCLLECPERPDGC